MILYIHNAAILTPDRQIDDGALLVDGPLITRIGRVAKIACPAKARRIDASGLWLTPGFIDLQINGGFGHDFTADPATIPAVAAHLPRFGVTSFLPTIISSPIATIEKAQEVQARGISARRPGATPLGLHIEGPFINPAKKGAHQSEYLRLPNAEIIRDWSARNGIRLVTLAPELPGALELISELRKRGVVVSAGHSLASYPEAQAGILAGISYGTHIFNAMPPLDHREPGLIGALLADKRLLVGLIPDGIHVHPALVALVWQLMGSRRLTLVSDATAALGMPPGRYRLGNQEVSVDKASARLNDGRLAGTILSLDEALRNLIAFTDRSLPEIIATVTSTPAALLRLSPERGKIIEGAFADMVLLTADLQVAMTIIKGEIAFPQDQSLS